MAATIHPTTADLISVIFSGDPAVDSEKSDIGAYIRSGGDEAHLVLTGTPTRYNFIPLTRRQRDYIFSEEGSEANPSIRGYATFGLSLHSIEGPEETILSEDAVRRLKRRAGGLLRIPDEAPIWDDASKIPDGAAVEVGNVAFLASFRTR